jgi:hypothetical protein
LDLPRANVSRSEGPSKPLTKVANSSPYGGFSIRGIAPGSYKIFALEDADADQVMYDPDFLKPYDSKAQSIEIDEGGKVSVRLKLIKG